MAEKKIADRVCLKCGREFPVYSKHPNVVYCSKRCFQQRNGTDRPLAERLMELVEILPNGCWRWLGLKSSQGYALFYLPPSSGKGKKMAFAHRVAYESFSDQVLGKTILDHICHDPKTCKGGPSCPHRSCVNPWHIEPSTSGRNCSRARNCRSAQLTLYHAAHRENHCINGHELTAENTYRYGRNKAFRMCVECSRKKSPDQRREEKR